MRSSRSLTIQAVGQSHATRVPATVIGVRSNSIRLSDLVMSKIKAVTTIFVLSVAFGALSTISLQVGAEVRADGQAKKTKESPKGGWNYEHEEYMDEDDPADPGRKDRMALCDTIKDRLNQYSYPDPAKAHAACGVLSTLIYPGFGEPPWQELDPKKYEELIWKLFKYRGQGSEGYFGRGEKNQSFVSDERYQKEAKDFITQGGRVQLWRTHLLNQLDDKPAPSGPQNIIQLRYKLDKSVVNETCRGIPISSWIGSLYVVKDDLSEPDPRVRLRDATLSRLSLIFYRQEPYFISGDWWEVDMYKDLGTGPSNFCQITYSKGVK